MNTDALAEGFERLRGRAQRHSSIQLSDSGEAVIFGFRAVLDYNENRVIIRLPLCNAEFIGTELKMLNFGPDGIAVRGRIHSLTFSDEVKR